MTGRCKDGAISNRSTGKGTKVARVPALNHCANGPLKKAFGPCSTPMVDRSRFCGLCTPMAVLLKIWSYDICPRIT